MFKYKLRNAAIDINSDSYIEDYLYRLGVRKVESFTDAPGDEDELSPFLLNNIKEGLYLLKKHLNSSIQIVVDSDVDGYTSAAIMYSFLKKLNPEADIEYYIHPEKEHGVVPSMVPFGTGLVIVPDAGSNQIDELMELEGRSVDVLVLDHHLVDSTHEGPGIVVINNQTSEKFSNKNLSGAGIVYKFCQAYHEEFGGAEFYKDFIDLAALGIISDMMSSKDLDNNYIIYHGLMNIKNPMFQALLNKQAFSITSTSTPNKIDIAFYVTPIINGTIRMGSMSDKQELFEALVTYDSTEIFTRVYRGKIIEETLYEKIARESFNIKQNQNTVTTKTMEIICKDIEDRGLQNNQIIIYTTENLKVENFSKSLTGLVAMKISAKFNRPTLILRPVNENGKLSYRGSGRGKKVEGFMSFKDFLTESGLVEYAQGHDMAFGAGVPAENITKLIEYANTTLSNVDFGTDTVEVDYIFNNSNLHIPMLYEFGQHMRLYGNGIPQPLFAFELVIQPDNIRIQGKDENTVKISYGGVDLIKFKSPEMAEMASYYQTQGLVRATIVGRAQLNEFNGNIKPQIIMDYLDLEEVVIEKLF